MLSGTQVQQPTDSLGLDPKYYRCSTDWGKGLFYRLEKGVVLQTGKRGCSTSPLQQQLTESLEILLLEIMEPSRTACGRAGICSGRGNEQKSFPYQRMCHSTSTSSLNSMKPPLDLIRVCPR